MSNMIRSVLVLLMLSITSIYASSDAIKKVVIQVDSSNLKTQNLALNNAVNLQKFYGMDNVKVEIVAYGPGLSILTRKSKFSKRVSSLAMSDVKFSACHNTMQKIKNKTGKFPALSDGVEVVPAGVVRIVQLEDQGYRYIRP
ncbi:DsrE family protein [Sulfurospirillum sp. 1612]|uniref:DsrE family protein n=1 Tax=Sulfurospirillum sp. 1612 TaxID=3094835 RepID=UPI002F943855